MKKALTILFVLIATTCYTSMAQRNVFVEDINKYENEKAIYELFNNQIVDIHEKEIFIRDKTRKLREKKDEKGLDENYKNLKAILKRRIEFYKEFINENKNTLVGALAVINVIDRSDCSGIYSESEIITLVQNFNKIPKGVIKTYLAKKINILKNIQIGENCPLIKEENSKGKIISTYDFKGKYLIIDFWASWCCGCRQESPYC